MPGASLWIVPPASSPFNQVLQTLISNTIPPYFPEAQTHDFIPHLTLTSNIDQSLYKEDPQVWLGSLHFPPNPQHEPTFITLDALEAGDPFVKKLTLRSGKSEQLLQLAAAFRAAAVENGDIDKAQKWANNDYLPHLSLMYSDISASEVETHLDQIREECRKAARRVEADDDGTVCNGGSIVLVDTSKPIHEWSVIAQRNLPHLKWDWPWSKSRFDD